MRSAARATGQFRRHLAPLVAAVVLDSSGSGTSWWLAHQTSQIPPRTGILSTTMRKKIGQNPVKGESLGSSAAGFDGEPAAPGEQRFGFRLLQPEGRVGRHQQGRLRRARGPSGSSCRRGCRRSRPAPGRGVGVERPELPVRRAEAGGAVEGEVGELLPAPASSAGRSSLCPPSRSPRSCRSARPAAAAARRPAGRCSGCIPSTSS